MTRGGEAPDRVPRYARPFVVLLVAAMTACALFVWEPWPFTSFRLFSHERIDSQSAFEARAASAIGHEADYPIGNEDRGFRGFPFVMSEFVGASADRRAEICRVWLDAAPDVDGVPAAAIRIYKRTWRLSDREDDRALPGTTELVYVCDEDGAHDAAH